MIKTFRQFKNISLQVVVLVFFNCFTINAQTTNFYGTKKIQSTSFVGALKEVKIHRFGNGYTYVKIEQIPTKNMKKLMAVLPSLNTKIKSGPFEAPYLGILNKDESLTKYSCDSNLGWDNVVAGKSYYITYVFDGAIPPGLTDFSMIDSGSNTSCKGYGFINYTINNPDNHPKTNLDLTSIKQIVDKQNDGIVGIYEPYGKSEYTFGCIRDNGIYKLIYLGSVTHHSYRNWWKIGDVKAILRPSSISGIFKADWYISNKSLYNNLANVIFDGNTLKTITELNGNIEETEYLKMYPTGSDSFSSNGQKSSGTGFAISNNGYIVTNYHVIENANTIEVIGVNGNFSEKLSAEVLVSDEKNDLAIVKINDPNFTTLGTIPYTFRQGIAEVGENVFVLGYPMISSMGKEIKLTNGIISSKTGFKGDISAYQVSVPIQPGNSGGPLFDKNGNILGVINAKHLLAENASYAIKVNYLKNLIELLPQTIKQPKLNSLNGKTLTDQVKIASNYTYLIVVNDKESSYINNTDSTPKKRTSSEQNAAMYYKNAEELWINNDSKGAIEQMNLSIDASQNYYGSYYFRGYIYLYGIRNYDIAIEDFTKAIQMQPDFEEGYFYRGLAYYDLEKNIEAIKDFSKVITLNRENTDAYFMRGIIKSNMNDRNGAISDYDEIIKREKVAKPKIYKMGTVYNNKGYCLVELNRLDEALPFLNKALELEPNESYIWGSRGELYYKRGDYRKCIIDMKKALEVSAKTEAGNTDPGLPYYLMGLSKIKLGEKEEGCKDLSKSGELGKTEAFKAISENCK